MYACRRSKGSTLQWWRRKTSPSASLQMAPPLDAWTRRNVSPNRRSGSLCYSRLGQIAYPIRPATCKPCRAVQALAMYFEERIGKMVAMVSLNRTAQDVQKTIARHAYAVQQRGQFSTTPSCQNLNHAAINVCSRMGCLLEHCEYLSKRTVRLDSQIADWCGLRSMASSETPRRNTMA